MISFSQLQKTDSKKAEPVIAQKLKTPKYISKYKQFIARKDKDKDDKFVYTVYDLLAGRDVMKWTAKNKVDEKVKDYIDRCYGLSKTIVTFK